MRTTIALLLALSLVGCKKPGGGAATGGGSGTPPSNSDLGGTLGRGPAGGSATLPGQIRDRAVDTQIMNEMRQVKPGLEADYPDGRGPADKAAWVAFLRDYRNLRKMVNDGEVVAHGNVNFRSQPGGLDQTVLMYEKRVVDHNDGIVLTCDGVARRMTKAQLNALAKPR